MLSTKSTPQENNQNDSASKSSAFDDLSSSPSPFDRNSNNIMSKSFNENMFFNRNKIEVSHFDFNLCLDSEGNGVGDEKVMNGAAANAEARNSFFNNTPSRNNKQPDPGSSHSASPLMMPKYHSQSSISSAQESPAAHSRSHRSNGAGPASGVMQRQQIPKHKRPLTRYLPNFSLDFNLRHHIETAGHQIPLCPHVIIDGNCLCFVN